MADVESFEEMVGTREAAAVAIESGGTVATESGGTVVTESGGTVATESGGAGTTGDGTVATVGDEAATGRIMYEDKDPYTIDVPHVEAMVGTTREAADGDRIGRRRDGDETGGPRDETHGHVMQHIIKILFYLITKFIYQPIFTIFAAKNSAISRL